MNPRRRILIVLISVTVGSTISLYFIRQRMGTLKPQDYVQLGFNFVFAAAIVIGIALLLNYMNNKNK